MDEDVESGVVKMGVFLSEYLEGVPNSKIFKLCRAIYESMTSESQATLDHPGTTLTPFGDAQKKELFDALSKKNYNKVRDLVKDQIKEGEASKETPQEEINEGFLRTMKQDDDHDFAFEEKVVVRRSDGSLSWGQVFFAIDERFVVTVSGGTKIVGRDMLWHF